MDFIYAFFIFILGLSFGSFLNVLILRYSSGYSSDKSKCLNCSKALSAIELVPLISFLVQKGRCRSCKSKLSMQYPAVELASAILFLLLFFLNDKTIDLRLLLLFIVAFVSVAIAGFDIKHKVIPSVFQYMLFVAVFFLTVVDYKIFVHISFIEFLTYKILSAFLLSSPYFLIWFLSKGRAMGFADAKIAFALGMLLYPSEVYSAVVLSFIFGAIFSVFYIALYNFDSKRYKSEIAFAPFILLSVWLVYLFNFNLLM